MPASATVELTFDAPAQADAVEAALAPEMGRDVPGSMVTMARRGDALELRMRAEDGGALRAALNSYLRWVRLALAMDDLAGGG